MATRWIDRIVEMRYMEGMGTMTVIDTDGSWVGCEPTDSGSRVATLAKLTADGVLWFRKHDIRECKPQGETLL